jgi:hypothetical protein
VLVPIPMLDFDFWTSCASPLFPSPGKQVKNNKDRAEMDEDRLAKQLSDLRSPKERLAPRQTLLQVPPVAPTGRSSWGYNYQGANAPGLQMGELRRASSPDKPAGWLVTPRVSCFSAGSAAQDVISRRRHLVKTRSHRPLPLYISVSALSIVPRRHRVQYQRRRSVATTVAASDSPTKLH